MSLVGSPGDILRYQLLSLVGSPEDILRCEFYRQKQRIYGIQIFNNLATNFVPRDIVFSPVNSHSDVLIGDPAYKNMFQSKAMPVCVHDTLVFGQTVHEPLKRMRKFSILASLAGDPLRACRFLKRKCWAGGGFGRWL